MGKWKRYWRETYSVIITFHVSLLHNSEKIIHPRGIYHALVLPSYMLIMQNASLYWWPRGMILESLIHPEIKPLLQQITPSHCKSTWPKFQKLCLNDRQGEITFVKDIVYGCYHGLMYIDLDLNVMIPIWR